MDSSQVPQGPRTSRVPRSSLARLAGVAMLPAALDAWAQAAPTSGGPTTDIATRSQVQMVFDRLEGPGLIVVIVAIVVILLLMWRIVAAIRRERPIVPPPRPPRVEPLETIGGPPSIVGGSTDWGHDMNKRSAVGRRPAVVAASRADDTGKVDALTTQWPAVDQTPTVRAGITPPDALGGSPDAKPSPYRTGFNPYYNAEQVDNRIEVEEVADTLTQAELLVQLGDPKEAMNPAVAAHPRDRAPRSPRCG